MSEWAKESCGCGATFEASRYLNSSLDDALAKWRTGHRHHEPVEFELLETESVGRIIGDMVSADEWRLNANAWRRLFTEVTREYDIPHDANVVRVESEFRRLTSESELTIDEIEPPVTNV